MNLYYLKCSKFPKSNKTEIKREIDGKVNPSLQTK